MKAGMLGSDLSTWNQEVFRVVKSSDSSLISASALRRCTDESPAGASRSQDEVSSLGKCWTGWGSKSQDASIHIVTLRLSERNPLNSLPSCCMESVFDTLASANSVSLSESMRWSDQNAVEYFSSGYFNLVKTRSGVTWEEPPSGSAGTV